MKIIGKISLLFGLLLAVNLVFATGTEVKEPENTSQQQGEKKQTPDEGAIQDGSIGGSEPLSIQSFDSTDDDSVSKYNFIFYFLYKLKYNDDGEIEALF